MSGSRWAVPVSLLALVVLACGNGRGPLPEGPTLGAYASSGRAESYFGPALYTYMNGGAEVFHEYGFSRAWVRRYKRGPEELLVELYEMKDAVSAGALYSYMRPSGSEADLGAGCRGSLAGCEAKLAKGRHYLVCRNENPLAKDGAAVRDLCGRLAARLDGPCGVGDLFRNLPSEARAPGSEILLAGPLGLNLRPWLAPLGREGFDRGWLASYTVASGVAEVFLGRYFNPDLAGRAAFDLRVTPRPGTRFVVRGQRIAVARGEGMSLDELDRLAERALASPGGQ